MRPPLLAYEVEALPEGTPVTVIWSGGNGPHRYVISVDEHGRRYVWNGTSERLRFYNPLLNAGQERYQTRVWLDEP